MSQWATQDFVVVAFHLVLRGDTNFRLKKIKVPKNWPVPGMSDLALDIVHVLDAQHPVTEGAPSLCFGWFGGL